MRSPGRSKNIRRTSNSIVRPEAALTAHQSGTIGLIGDPVEHSLSPAFQQAALDALGLPIRYVLLPTPAGDIPARINELRDGDYIGVNVTVPHKEVFFSHVDECSELAKQVGAINTIAYRNGRLVGDNTDVHGFVQSLRDADYVFEGSVAVVLGAGGASRAVIVGLLSENVERIVLANRTIERAQAVVDSISDSRIEPVTLLEALEHAPEASLLVNATSLGWQHETLPVDHSIFTRLQDGAIAYDLTYKETRFLAAATEHGVKTIDGFSMLIHQGARSFEIWTGQKPPLDVMWDAASQARNP
jgi:shikimate dehydrogenase